MFLCQEHHGFLPAKCENLFSSIQRKLLNADLPVSVFCFQSYKSQQKSGVSVRDLPRSSYQDELNSIPYFEANPAILGYLCGHVLVTRQDRCPYWHFALPIAARELKHLHEYLKAIHSFILVSPVCGNLVFMYSKTLSYERHDRLCDSIN